MTSEMEGLVTKGAFAGMCNVSPGRVSQWISEQKIHGPAIVGQGRKAKIHAVTAQAQLNNTLDISQRFGNGLTTNLDQVQSQPALEPTPRIESQAPEFNQPLSLPSEPENKPTPPPENKIPTAPTIEDKIKEAKLFEIETRNRRAKEEERARQGRYIEATTARAEMSRIAGSMLKVFEGGLTDIAGAIASKFEIPHRDVTHLMRQEFLAVRAKASETYNRTAENFPALVEDEEDAAANGNHVEQSAEDGK